jgi:predicted RecA/RadA family phage recombinase
MATATFVQDGEALDYTPTADVAAGDVVVQNALIGIAKTPIKANALGSLAVIGVFSVPKATGGGTGIAAGAKVYWIATIQVATASENDGGQAPVHYPYLGKVVAAAADADTTVRVRLSQDA